MTYSNDIGLTLQKLVHTTALKATVGYVIPKGYEPYSEYRPDEQIDTLIAPSGILQRGTPSIVETICLYKELIELKRQCAEIWFGK